MARRSVSFDDVLNSLDRFSPEEKQKLREHLQDKNWFAELYKAFEPVREKLRRYPSEKINRDIRLALQAARRHRKKRPR